ncbi:hypothetical protein Tco_0317528 [Tanacetum coccineum]
MFMLIQVQLSSLFPYLFITVEDSEPVQEEIDLFLVPDDLIPPGVENDDSEDEENSTFLPEHESEDLVFDLGISTFHFSLKPVPFALPKDE